MHPICLLIDGYATAPTATRGTLSASLRFFYEVMTHHLWQRLGPWPVECTWTCGCDWWRECRPARSDRSSCSPCSGWWWEGSTTQSPAASVVIDIRILLDACLTKVVRLLMSLINMIRIAVITVLTTSKYLTGVMKFGFFLAFATVTDDKTWPAHSTSIRGLSTDWNCRRFSSRMPQKRTCGRKSWTTVTVAKLQSDHYNLCRNFSMKHKVAKNHQLIGTLLWETLSIFNRCL